MFLSNSGYGIHLLRFMYFWIYAKSFFNMKKESSTSMKQRIVNGIEETQRYSSELLKIIIGYRNMLIWENYNAWFTMCYTDVLVTIFH